MGSLSEKLFALVEHGAPLRRGCLRTEPKEAQARGRENSAAHTQRTLDHDGCPGVGQDLAEDNNPIGCTRCPSAPTYSFSRMERTCPLSKWALSDHEPPRSFGDYRSRPRCTRGTPTMRTGVVADGGDGIPVQPIEGSSLVTSNGHCLFGRWGSSRPCEATAALALVCQGSNSGLSLTRFQLEGCARCWMMLGGA